MFSTIQSFALSHIGPTCYNIILTVLMDDGMNALLSYCCDTITMLDSSKHSNFRRVLTYKMTKL